jgi:hypothetical protein
MWMVPRCWGGLGPGRGAEVRQLGQRDVDLQRGARVAIRPTRPGTRRVARALDETRERDGRRHCERQRRPSSSPLARTTRRRGRPGRAGHLGLAPDLDTELPRSPRERLGEPAHAAAHIPPDAAPPVGLPHDVVEEDVGRARHGRAGHGADDGVGGQGTSLLDSNQRSRTAGRRRSAPRRPRRPGPRRGRPPSARRRRSPRRRAAADRRRHGEGRLDQPRLARASPRTRDSALRRAG